MILVCATWAVLLVGPQDDVEAEAIARIKRVGGTVRKVADGLEIGLHLKARNSASELLPSIGKLDNVVWLSLAKSNVNDNSLKSISKLTSLRSLHLENTKVNDQGIKHLTGLENLEYLNLYGTNVSNESVKQLAKLAKLKKLYVWQSKLTDSGLRDLQTLMPKTKVVGGVDLAKLATGFPSEAEEPKPKQTLNWMKVESRNEAPVRSNNGVNCQVWFENKTMKPVKLYWISYGAGELKYYATLKPKEVRKQNSYSRNAWLITDLEERPLGYFVAKDDDAMAIIR